LYQVFIAMTKIWNAGVKFHIADNVGSSTHLTNLAREMLELVPSYRQVPVLKKLFSLSSIGAHHKLECLP
jgi:hypothetical protein